MRRLLLAAAWLGLHAAPPPVRAARFGLDLSAGFFDPATTDLDKDLAHSRANLQGEGSVNARSVSGGFNLLVEGDGPLRLGAAAGLYFLPTASSAITFRGANPGDSYQKVDLAGLEFPFSVYFKGVAERGWGLLVGGGLTHIMARANYRLFIPNNQDASATFRRSAWSPHLVLGGEMFLGDSVSLCLGARYLIDAGLDDFRGTPSSGGTGEYRLLMIQDAGGETLGAAPSSAGVPAGTRLFRQDYGGPRLTLGVRYYFGGGLN